MGVNSGVPKGLAIPAPLVSPVMELSLFLVIKITRMLIIIEVGNIDKNVKIQYKFVHLSINNNHNLRIAIQDSIDNFYLQEIQVGTVIQELMVKMVSHIFTDLLFEVNFVMIN
jgi:hypothetical protein